MAENLCNVLTFPLNPPLSKGDFGRFAPLVRKRSWLKLVQLSNQSAFAIVKGDSFGSPFLVHIQQFTKKLSNKFLKDNLGFLMLYNKRDFKACEARKRGVYLNVNEDFEGERNAKITLLDSFIIYLCFSNLTHGIFFFANSITSTALSQHRASAPKATPS